MSFFTTQWVSKVLGLSPPLDARTLTHITSDTREIHPGALFVAMQGETTDGHQYMENALAAGAVAAVHLRDFPPPTGLLSFPVDNTLEAWRALAKGWRQEFSLPVAVVAGSAGKTTSKEMLAALLRGKWKNVLFTQASQNGFQGVPTTLLRLRAEHEAAVIEVGIDEPGAMAQHLNVVAPDAGLLTSIGAEHLEKLIDLDTVEHEEGLLFGVLEGRQGFAAVNLDDERIARQAKQLKSTRRLTYGIDNEADIRGRLSQENEKHWLEVENLGPEIECFLLPLEGKHNALNLLGALTLAQGLGLNPEEMRAGLSTFTPPPGRSEMHELHGYRVLVDTYNANPASVVAALETLFSGFAGDSWAVLGDMLELGALEEEFHRSLTPAILRQKVRHVLLYGPRMKHLQKALEEGGFRGTLEHFDSHEMIAARLRASLQPGARLLLKGSRGMRMEQVWKVLKETP